MFTTGLPSTAELRSAGRTGRPPLRGSRKARRLLGHVSLGVTRRSNPRYNVYSCYALERLHFASPDVLDRGARLSPPIPFRSAFARACQSLWQRLITLFPSLLS